MTSSIQYYLGGFAEIVDNPSPLTYSYLSQWFCGNNSLGSAMSLLGLPYSNSIDPVLEIIDGELVVNLKIEEETLYNLTLFSYSPQKNLTAIPKLRINPAKLISPLNWLGTLKILFAQAKWIGQSPKMLVVARGWISTIPEKIDDNLEETLSKNIWPKVLAVGFLSEFYIQLLNSEDRANLNKINGLISSKLSSHDWYFLAGTDQIKVKKGTLSFAQYIKTYGLRADKDYELTSPRWYEIPEVIKKRISDSKEIKETNSEKENYEGLTPNILKLIDTVVEFQLLRSEAKRKALYAIDLLRQKTQASAYKAVDSRKKKHEIKKPVTSGLGTGIAMGYVSGKALYIDSTSALVPENTIGIFPNASPEFSVLYPKCAGMIFLRGAMTSHGAIVAREYKIPALVDENAEAIVDGSLITMNGATGAWKID